MHTLPCRNAWQSGEGIKTNEISSKTTAAQTPYSKIRLGEQTTFIQRNKQHLSSSSLPTPHPSSNKSAQTILPTFLRYLSCV